MVLVNKVMIRFFMIICLIIFMWVFLKVWCIFIFVICWCNWFCVILFRFIVGINNRMIKMIVCLWWVDFKFGFKLVVNEIDWVFWLYGWLWFINVYFWLVRIELYLFICCLVLVWIFLKLLWFWVKIVIFIIFMCWLFYVLLGKFVEVKGIYIWL